jgi:hypothetical protein
MKLKDFNKGKLLPYTIGGTGTKKHMLVTYIKDDLEHLVACAISDKEIEDVDSVERLRLLLTTKLIKDVYGGVTTV